MSKGLKIIIIVLAVLTSLAIISAIVFGGTTAVKKNDGVIIEKQMD